MNTLNQKPLTLHAHKEVPIRSGIYPQAGLRKWALWRRRCEAHEAVEKPFCAEEASVASALYRLVAESIPTVAARASVEQEGRAVRAGSGPSWACVSFVKNFERFSLTLIRWLFTSTK